MKTIRIKSKVDIKFLKKKLIKAKVGWGTYGAINVTSQNTNAKRISENVFSFTEYNFLPIDGRTFDGHYTFYVNYKTFKYLVIQDSYYGSFTYTTPAKERGWKKLNSKDKKYAESIIADKLLGMYYFDHNAVNQNGKNLFSTGEKEKAGNSFNPGIIRYCDGRKGSLICDPILELTKIDKRAINLLN